MDRDVVREIKDRIDIVEFIGETVQLRRAGRNFRGLCPFHSEKTPSFHVSSERQTYHCFGCGRGGDIFSFVMGGEGLSFPEVLEMLASRAGVSLERQQQGRSERKGVALAAMESALAFFSDSLSGPSGEAARKYLERRGIGAGAVRTFELGWAPSSWDMSKKHIDSLGVKMSDAMAAGLLSEGERGSYDRFRGRIIFPIRDVQGRLVAFGGRVVDGEGAKYINSPEGELYSKRKNLYLLNVARQPIREKGRSILVEGYMDAIRLHIAGFTETVASLGTALTAEQATLLKRFADQCMICYDSDTAGQEAAIRGMYVLQQSGLDIRVVVLPAGKDPDDLVGEKDGPKQFVSLLQRAEPLPLFHIRVRRSELEDPAKRTAARREIIRGLAEMPALEANRHITQVAQGLGILLPEMLDLLRQAREDIPGSKKGIPAAESVYKVGTDPSGEDNAVDPWESALCYLLWVDSKRRSSESVESVLGLLSDDRAKTIAVSLLAGESPGELRTRWAETGDPFPMRMISSGWAHCEKNGEEGEIWEVVISALERKRLRDRFSVLKERHARSEASPQEMKEYLALARRLKGGVGSP
jgi:DNA primase